MSNGEIAGRAPIVLDLEPDTYYWCACGKSASQPWCDGSHEGTEHEPLEVAISEKKKYALCLCKQSSNPPFCDGSHNNLG